MKKLMSVLMISFSICHVASAVSSAGARADFQATDKAIQGSVEITKSEKGIKFLADVRGLQPGSVHGFHIHEKGECKGPDFKSAGEHFNPKHELHSGVAAEHKHLGDLGNIVADDQGTAHTEVLIPSDQVKTLETFVGKSVIIHAKADDQTSQPSGNSGDRIACGVIK